MQFRRRITIAPGVRLNISKGGLRLTLGPPGMHYTVGSKGSEVNLGVPGTRLYYRQKLGGKARGQGAAARDPRHALSDAGQGVPPAPPNASPAETAFREGCALYTGGKHSETAQSFARLLESDSDFHDDVLMMHGLAASAAGQTVPAIESLGKLLEEGVPPLPGEDGSLVARYLPGATVRVPLTQYAAIDLPLNMTLASLLLSELLQSQAHVDEAIGLVEALWEASPESAVIQLALADLYTVDGRADALYDLLSKHPDHLEKAADDIALELMYHWAVALTARKLYDAADETYRRALKATADRNPDLVKLLEYGRADLYEEWDKKDDAR